MRMLPKIGSLKPVPVRHAKEGKVGATMREFAEGELHSGSKTGPKVTSKEQAVAIGLSQARKAGEDVPPKK